MINSTESKESTQPNSLKEINNKQINSKEKKVILRGDIYNKEQIVEASYLMLDRSFVTITGEIGKEVVILLDAKQGFEALDLEKTFHEELIQAAHNQKQDSRNAELQKTIMTSVLFSDTINNHEEPGPNVAISDSLSSEAQAFLSDTIEDIKAQKE